MYIYILQHISIFMRNTYTLKCENVKIKKKNQKKKPKKKTKNRQTIKQTNKQTKINNKTLI